MFLSNLFTQLQHATAPRASFSTARQHAVVKDSGGNTMGVARASSMRGPQRLSSTTGQQQQQPAAMFADVPMAKRVNQWIEWSGSGILLDLASAALSILTVMTYMVETHYAEDDPVWLSLRIVDQVCSIIFAAEWCFWLWLSRDRLGYILSWQSLVDIITIVPIFLSVFLSSRVPGFATFEAMVRIFRVVRVFRVFRLGKRLKDEVLSCVLTVTFTLLAVIVTGAGVFYEIETNFSDRYPDLTIEQAIYWSVVTVTTIGYGDFSPSITASQMTLLAMLFIAFTLLPYQTSMLVNALSETSIYQSAHYAHSTKGRHVVVTGHLTATAASTIVDELFHPDSGFADYNIVFLNPDPPSDAMKKLLKTSQHAHRVLYLQGSWASQQDLMRAQVETCDAVFVLCNKAPASAKQEDLQTVMTILAIGQYIQAKEKARLKVGPKPLMQRLREGFRGFMKHFHKAQKAPGIPRMVIQLLLPESKQQLQQLLNLYSKQGSLVAGSASLAVPAADTLAAVDTPHDAAATITTNSGPGSKAAALQDCSLSSGRLDQPPAAVAGGPKCWQRFARQVTSLSVTELRFGLLAHSCMGCPGTITLVSNLIRAVDDSVLTQAEFEGLQAWTQEYLEGSSNELYEVCAFPACLHGQTVAQVAEYLLDVHRAVLLATTGTQPASTNSSSSSGRQDSCRDHPGTAEGAAATAAKAAALPQHGSTPSRQRALVLSAQTLGEQVTWETVAYVIAADVRVVLDVMESTAANYIAWKAAKLLLREQRAKHSLTHQPAVVGALWRAKAAQHKQAHIPTDNGHMRTVLEPQKMLQQLLTDAAELQAPLGGSTSHDGGVRDPSNAQQQAADPSNGNAAAAAAQSATESSTSSRRTTAEQGASFGRAAAAAGLMGVSARSLLAALGGSTASGQEGSGAQRQRKRLGTIQVTRGTAILGSQGDDDDDDAQCSVAPSDPQQPQPTATPRQIRRTAMELSMQQLYHIRSWSRTAAECMEDMAQEAVHVEGHLLVCGCGTPPAALACLLKPLRSTALPGPPRPIVVLDTTSPVGPDWEELARLGGVYHVEGNPQSTEALVRACADTAATALVLLPWSWQTAGSDADDVVTAGMVDAGVLSVVRRLRALNPHAQVLSELLQNQSLRFLDPIGSLLDECAVDEASAAAASPAFMSGAVLLPFMDILMCQAINNRGTPHILANMLSTWHRQAHRPAPQDSHMHANTLAPDRQPAGQLVDTAGSGSAGQGVTAGHPAQHGSCALLQPEQLCGFGAAVLQQVPAQHTGCSTFGELFDWLLQHRGMLCCGLYRQATHYGVPLWYVYTNPHKDVELRCTDRAFVLGPAQSVRH